LEIAYQRKHEIIEELKQECKKNKVAKDVEKKNISGMQSSLDLKRKQGIKDVKQKLSLITDNDQISISEKISRL
jgi:hypothetical protein